MEPLRISPSEAITLLSVIGACLCAVKVYCVKWQNERLREANKHLRKEMK